MHPGPAVNNVIKAHWFIISLFLVFVLILGDSTGTVSEAGRWLKDHGGPDAAIIFIFFFSGILLEFHHIRSGLQDLQGMLAALGLIFIVSPLLAVFPGVLPLDQGVKIGIFLVAVMPSTLSTGVVMTHAAGGNMAHALGITVLSNWASVFAIPLLLSLLLQLIGTSVAVAIDKSAIMIQIGTLVILPLVLGMVAKWMLDAKGNRLAPSLQVVNQLFVLVIVWISLSQSRTEIVADISVLPTTASIAVLYHGLVWLAAGGIIYLLQIPRGRRESVLFMGGQKTLVLSLILQASLFPEYGSALAYCVIHHIVHLLMDGYLVERLKIAC